MFHVKTVYNSKCDEGSGLGLFGGTIEDTREETKSMITLSQNTR